jgi:uncharacterized protein
MSSNTSKIAVITGGSRGLGRNTALNLAKRGVNCVLTYRSNQAEASRTVAEIGELGARAVTLPLDTGETSQFDQFTHELKQNLQREWGRSSFDYLVNNAGFGIHAKLTSTEYEKFDRGFDVMARAVLILGGAAGRAMRARGRGTIVNVASVAGMMAMGAYSAIKSWALVYSEGLAVELKGTGVTVTALAPGWVRTEFHDRAGIRTASIPNWMWIGVTPLVEGAIRDAAHGRVISVPGGRWKVLMTVVRLLPRLTIRWVSGKISSSRSEEPAPVTAPNHTVDSAGRGA